ncbi:MAG TPA: hypothetical protein VE053_11140 [Allosphingosinicella sp.]|nr:hypothetical protein [Allosphingosinicella sp.]
MMRVAAAALLLGLAAGCDASPPPIDRIEIRVSGESAVDIAVDGGGEGSFRLSEPFPGGRSGTFSVTPEQFQRLRERLERYRRQAVPTTDESAREFVERTCPRDVPFVTDAGGVYVRWIGSTSDQHFLADLGCDRERRKWRNQDLLGIVRSLPVPQVR